MDKRELTDGMDMRRTDTITMNGPTFFFTIMAMSRLANGNNTTQIPITFQRLGQLSPSVSDFLLVGRIELRPIFRELRRAQNVIGWLDAAAEKLDDIHASQRLLVQAQSSILRRELTEITVRARNIRALFTPRRTRNRRSVMLALGAAAIIGSSVASLMHTAYIQERIEEVQDSVNGELQYVDLTAELSENNQRRLAAVNATLFELIHRTTNFQREFEEEIEALQKGERLLLAIDACQSSILHLQTGMDQLIEVYTMALHGRISTTLLNPRQVQEQVSLIKERLPPGKKLALDSDDLRGFYQLKCHLVETSDGLVVVIPIPVIGLGQEFSVFRHLRTPVAAGNDAEMILRTSKEFLVLNRENTLHTEISADELEACANVESLFLCPHIRVFMKPSRPSCLYLLYEGRVKEAQRICDHAFRITGKLDITQLSDYEFLATSTSVGTRAAQRCGSEATTTSINIPMGISKLELPAGCSLNTDLAYVVPGPNSTMGRGTFIISGQHEIDIDVENLLHQQYPHLNVKTEEIAGLLQQLTTTGDTVSLQDLMAARHRIKEISHPHWIPMIFTTIGMVSTVTFFTWVCLRYHLRGRKRPRPDTQEAIPLEPAPRDAAEARTSRTPSSQEGAL